jgi:alkanesulfonate monooxygenase SsuD/methylene tetrahydromethanopterin reductase-like flavin-dependent oxidoreductase (luciferase family)
MSAEALDILVQGFTSERLNFEGKYYSYKDVGLWNKPYQKPYPPLWYPRSNIDSVPYAAGHGFRTSHNFATDEVAKPHIQLYWDELGKHKNDPERFERTRSRALCQQLPPHLRRAQR